MSFDYELATCSECGTGFGRAVRKNASPCCSEACRVRRFRRLNPTAGRPARSLSCGWCERHFSQRGSGRNRICCSTCGPRSSKITAHGRRRARELGRAVELFRAHEVFQRDEWTCALCLGAIDRQLRHPDPLSPSLDHRVPLQRGGDHTVENCQAAHLVCNLWKGMRTQHEVAAVVPIYSAVSPAWAEVA